MKKFTFACLGLGTALLCVSGPELFCEAKLSAAPVTVSAATNEITWLTDYDAALKQATTGNRLVMIDFYTPWCGYCRLMEKKTFTDAKVQAQLAGFVRLKIDGDQQPQIAAKYGVQGFPTTLVVDATGKPVVGAVGYVTPDFYLTILDQAKIRSAPTGVLK
ncbi:MAG TPA: thioredoxin family protein [Verrucomicrobiae bacterium]|nr:thioredoxin family protein [Verrucomicrobiae bacterium]